MCAPTPAGRNYATSRSRCDLGDTGAMPDASSELAALRAAQQAVTRNEAEIRMLCEVLSAVYDVAEAAVTALEDPTTTLQHLRSLICVTAQIGRHGYVPPAARAQPKD